MAFNGSGTYVRSFTWATDKANAVAVTATRFDTEDDGFATGLSTCICKDGQTTTTARIPFSLGISLGTGTVSLPAINFTSDTNTGIYSSGADAMSLVCGGAAVAIVATGSFSVTGVVGATTGFSTAGTLGVGGATALSGTLAVTGVSTLTGAVSCSASLSVGTTSHLIGAVTMDAALTLGGIGTTASAANLFSDGSTGLVSRSTSSSKYKTDVEDISIEEARRVYSQLRPIKFRSKAKADDPKRQHFGLIAEEVAAIDPRFVHFDGNGKPDGVQYDRLLIPLLKIMQDARL